MTEGAIISYICNFCDKFVALAGTQSHVCTTMSQCICPPEPVYSFYCKVHNPTAWVNKPQESPRWDARITEESKKELKDLFFDLGNEFAKGMKAGKDE